jgi:hypothetical protein
MTGVNDIKGLQLACNGFEVYGKVRPVPWTTAAAPFICLRTGSKIEYAPHPIFIALQRFEVAFLRRCVRQCTEAVASPCCASSGLASPRQPGPRSWIGTVSRLRAALLTSRRWGMDGIGSRGALGTRGAAGPGRPVRGGEGGSKVESE